MKEISPKAMYFERLNFMETSIIIILIIITMLKKYNILMSIAPGPRVAEFGHRGNLYYFRDFLHVQAEKPWCCTIVQSAFEVCYLRAT